MVNRIIQYLSQCTDILKLLLVLVMVVTFITGNLRDCLMKESILLRRLIVVALHSQIIMALKKEVEFNGSCLKQDKITYTHGKVVNICFVYEKSKSINISDYQALEKCLFGAVSLTTKTDIDRNGYSGYGIGFDRHGSFFYFLALNQGET